MSQFQYEDILERLAESFTILAKYQDKAEFEQFTVSARGEPGELKESIVVHISPTFIELDDLVRLKKLGWSQFLNERHLGFDLFR
jgi:hypothetical protein